MENQPEVSNIAPICANCANWRGNDKQLNTVGTCFALPPTPVVAVTGPMKGNVTFVRSQTRPKEGCFALFVPNPDAVHTDGTKADDLPSAKGAPGLSIVKP